MYIYILLYSIYWFDDDPQWPICVGGFRSFDTSWLRHVRPQEVGLFKKNTSNRLASWFTYKERCWIPVRKAFWSWLHCLALYDECVVAYARVDGISSVKCGYMGRKPWKIHENTSYNHCDAHPSELTKTNAGNHLNIFGTGLPPYVPWQHQGHW